MRVYGQLKIAKNYQCQICSTIKQGTYLYVEIDCHNTDDAKSEIDYALENILGGFPIGWAGFGVGEYCCGDCLKKKEYIPKVEIPK